MIMRNPMNIFSRTGLIITSVVFISHISATELPVESVKEVTVADSLTFTGTVEAVNAGTASAEISGRVVKTLVDVGDLVSKDDVILQLRDTKQQASYDKAVAGVKAAEAKYNSAEKEYIRIINIRKKGLVSQSAADQVLSQRDSTKAALDAALASLKNAEEQLEYTRVKAPYSGIVLDRHVEVGETVNPGTPLYTGMSIEKLRVLTDVPQKDIDKIRRNKKASIELPNGDLLFVSDEKLTFFGYADPKTSTFKIRVNLPEGLQGLYPGMYLKTSFKVGDKTSLVIPKSSLIRRGEVTAVYIKKDEHVHFRHIRIGRILGNGDIEVLSGLSFGESVITSPSLVIASLSKKSGNDNDKASGADHE